MAKTEESVEKLYQELERQDTPEMRQKSKSKSAWTIVGNVFFVLVIVILFAALIFVQSAKENGATPSVFGISLFYVQTPSMEPTLPVGTIIMSKETNAENIEVGDIVTFRMLNGTVVTHRVVGVVNQQNGERAFRTKGDNPVNDMDPEILTADRIIAVFVAKIM